MRRYLILVLVIASYLNVLGQDCPSESLIQRSIKAFETDNNINWEGEDQEHQVYINPDCIPNDKLLVHLVGTFDNPKNTNYFPSLAANQGYKVINLKYLNWVPAVGACADSDDANCFQKYRQEIIFGTDVSSTVTVDSDNSIINRLSKLLIHLDNLYPSENWNHFLLGSNEINWSNIVVSGHSQGGGHAAFLGKQFEVKRVLMFAAPNDYSNFFSTPASWLNNESATPDSCYYAFGNLYDDVVDFDKQYQVWESMNLLNQSDTVDVDNTAPDYNNSKLLYTKNNASFVFSGNHNAMIIDEFTPLSAGIPVFTSVWEYMLRFDSDITSTTSVGNSFSAINAFPNPTSDQLFISSEKIISQIEIYSLSGKLLDVSEPNKNSFDVNLEAYIGLLLLKISTIDNKNKMIKVIVN